MSVTQAPPLTVEDYRSLPETGPRYQLIEGDLHMAPAPNRYHQDISLNLAILLSKYLEKHPIGRIYYSPLDVYLTETSAFQPDIIFVSNENLNILTEAGAEGPPDLVVEILSERTAHLDKTPKRRVNARAGVKELWLVDPEVKTVSVFYLRKLAERPSAIYCETDTLTSPCFPGLKIKGSRVFKH